MYAPRSMRANAALALVLLGATGCPSAYLNAVNQFGQAAQAGAGSLGTAFDLSSQLCRDRADLAYLLPRFKAQYGQPLSFTADPLRSKWFSDKTAGPADRTSWDDHCNAIADADKVHRAGLAMIGAYGWALGAVVGQGKFEGNDLRESTAAISSVVQTLGGGAAAPYTGAIAGVGGPLTAMTDFLIAKIAGNKLREKIAQADPIYQKILDALLAYLDAAGEMQYLDLQSSLGNVLDEIELGLGPQGAFADPVRGLEYYKFAVYWEKRLRFYRRSIDTTRKLIQDLKSAHAALKHAGDADGSPNVDDLKKMGGFASQVVDTANYFRTSLAPPLGVP